MDEVITPAFAEAMNVLPVPEKVVRVAVLSGGGSKFAFHAAVLKGVLFVAKEPYDLFVGTSAGAIAAAVMAQGAGLASQQVLAGILVDKARQIKADDIFKDGGWLRRIPRLLKTGAMFDSSPLAKLLAQMIPQPNPNSASAQARVACTDLNSGMVVVASSKDSTFLTGVLASASVPGVFPAVPIGGQLLVDGGVREMAPLGIGNNAAKHTLGATRVEMDVYLTQPFTQDPDTAFLSNTGAFGILNRSLTLIEREVFLNDVEQTVYRTIAPRPGDLPVTVRVFAPTKTISDKALDFSPEVINEALFAGAEAAKSPLEGQALIDRLGL